MSLLSLQTVTKIFGGLTAVNEVSFDVEQGSIVGLIGPNGAPPIPSSSFSTSLPGA